MTVIAYSSRHRILAADSRCTDAFGMHLTTCQKVYRLKSGAILGTAGDADERDFVDLLEKASPRKLPNRSALAELKGDFVGLLVFRAGDVFMLTSEWREREHEGNWEGEVLAIRDPIVSIGSGSPYAYGAMDHGASPVEAVRVACKRDNRCATPVQWLRLQ